MLVCYTAKILKNHSMELTLTIDLSTLKDHPDFSTGTGSTNTSSGTTTTTTITATVQWARYL
jgi:hypothetical protein